MHAKVSAIIPMIARRARGVIAALATLLSAGPRGSLRHRNEKTEHPWRANPRLPFNPKASPRLGARTPQRRKRRPSRRGEPVAAHRRTHDDSDLSEIEIEKGDLRIRAARGAATPQAPATFAPTYYQTAPAPAPVSAPAAKPAPIVEAPAAQAHNVKRGQIADGGHAYLRPNPEAKAFVEIGARVSAGDKLLLIEAMKTFNDIVAPKAAS